MIWSFLGVMVNTELIKTELEKNSVSFAFVDGRIIDVCEHNGKLNYEDHKNRFF